MQALTATGQEHGIHALELGIELLVHDIVFGYVELDGRGAVCVGGEFLGAGGQEGFEDAAVATIFGTGVLERCVAFEDGDAKGWSHVRGRQRIGIESRQSVS